MYCHICSTTKTKKFIHSLCKQTYCIDCAQTDLLLYNRLKCQMCKGAYTKEDYKQIYEKNRSEYKKKIKKILSIILQNSTSHTMLHTTLKKYMNRFNATKFLNVNEGEGVIQQFIKCIKRFKMSVILGFQEDKNVLLIKEDDGYELIKLNYKKEYEILQVEQIGLVNPHSLGIKFIDVNEVNKYNRIIKDVNSRLVLINMYGYDVVRELILLEEREIKDKLDRNYVDDNRRYALNNITTNINISNLVM